MTDAAEDAAEVDGAPLREFKNLLSEFAGEFSNNKKRDERFLSLALEKAEIPHRRIRVSRDKGANRITPWKERKPVAAALKEVYRAKGAETARQKLEDCDAGP